MRPVGDKNSGGPIIRFRPMFTVLLVVIGLIAGPLALVWKQSYITKVSMRLDAMADTLSTLNKKIAALRLECERLSRTERIEHFARAKLHLDYPSSDRIVILEKECGLSDVAAGEVGKIFAYARNYISKSR